MLKKADKLDNLAQDPRGWHIVTSTSLKAYRACPRKYWFSYVHRVRQPRKSVFTFGSVAHACIERHRLNFDGLVPTAEQAATRTNVDPFEYGGPLFGQTPGEPMQIFPEDYWLEVLERDGTVARITELMHVEQLQALVTMAIDMGRVPLWEEGQVERLFFRDLSDGMVYRSMIDYEAPGKVSDLQTVHSLKYAKKPEQLAEDDQLLAYAYENLMTYNLDQPIYVEHVQMLKKEMRVERTSADPAPTPEVLQANWNQMAEDSRKMAELIEQGPHYDWKSVPGPAKNSRSCTAYGGCPYKAICHETLPHTPEPPSML